jgi:hypothetical protein
MGMEKDYERAKIMKRDKQKNEKGQKRKEQSAGAQTTSLSFLSRPSAPSFGPRAH